MSTTPPTLVTMFIQIHTLPRTQRQLSLLNRNVQRHAHQTTLYMSRHVIIAFHRVTKRPIAIPRGGDNFVERRLHIGADVGIRIFIDGQRCRSVLDKQIAEAYLDFGNVGTGGFEDFSRDQVAAPFGGCDRNGVLEPAGLLHVRCAGA